MKRLIVGFCCIASAMTAMNAVEFAKPGAPANLRLTADTSTGVVTFSWDPVTTDVNGNPLKADRVRYLVYNTDGATIGIVDEPKFSRQEMAPGQYVSVWYAVRSGAVYADTIVSGPSVVKLDSHIVGPLRQAPIVESFVDFLLENEGSFTFCNSPTEKNLSTIYTDGQLKGVTSEDGDKSYMFCTWYNIGYSLRIVSADVDLSKCAKPVFVFHKLDRGENDKTKMVVKVRETWQTLEDEVEIFSTVSDSPVQAWRKVEVPLDKFAGKSVVVRLYFTYDGIPSLVLDNFRIIDKTACNMSVSKFTAPGRVDIDGNSTFKLHVHNNGDSDIDSYFVDLYCNGKVVSTFEGGAMRSLTTKVISLTTSADASLGETAEYYAVVRTAGDNIAYDNETEHVNVPVRSANVPQPTGLTAAGDGNVTLRWTAPELNLPVNLKPVTESFEDYEVFEYRDTHMGDWTLYDGDKVMQVLTTTIADFSFPTNGVPKAYVLLNNQTHGINKNIITLYGEKYLASFPCMPSSTQKDDWLISPRLSAVAQTIRFNALSAVAKKTANVELLYSDKTTDVKDFQLVKTITVEPTGRWDEYSFNVPATARYFAIRVNQKNMLTLFLVDNVTFIPEVMESNLVLKGYNVYRNGEKINDMPVTDTSFTDTESSSAGKRTYAVSAVYESAQSRCCVPVTVEGGTSGVNAAEMTDMVKSVRYFSPVGVELDPNAIQPGQIYIEMSVLNNGSVHTVKKVAQ